MGQLVRSVAAGRKAYAMFKSLSKVTVNANPFDPRSITAREFIRRVQTQPVRRANSKMKVEYNVTEDYGNPSIQLEYTDGYKQMIQSNGLKLVDILDEIERVARWKGEGANNPFGKLRQARAKQVGM